MKIVILKIEGMSCNNCKNHVEKYLNSQDGVKATVDLEKALATIEYDEEIVTISDLERFIEEAGYESVGVEDSIDE